MHIILLHVCTVEKLHTHTRTCTHTHTHARMHARTHSHTHTHTLQHPLPSSPIKNTSRKIPVPYCCTTPGAPSHPTPPPPPSSLLTQRAVSTRGNGRTLAQTNTVTCLRNHCVLTYPAKNIGENKTDTLAPCMSLCTCIKFCSGLPNSSYHLSGTCCILHTLHTAYQSIGRDQSSACNCCHWMQGCMCECIIPSKILW